MNDVQSVKTTAVRTDCTTNRSNINSKCNVKPRTSSSREEQTTTYFCSNPSNYQVSTALQDNLSRKLQYNQRKNEFAFRWLGSRAKPQRGIQTFQPTVPAPRFLHTRSPIERENALTVLDVEDGTGLAALLSSSPITLRCSDLDLFGPYFLRGFGARRIPSLLQFVAFVLRMLLTH